MTCAGCGRTKPRSCFAPRAAGVCRTCVRAQRQPIDPAVPIDISLGREPDGRRERIVRVARVHGVVRLLAAVRLDAAAVQVLGTFTLPVARVRALTTALQRLAAHP